MIRDIRFAGVRGRVEWFGLRENTTHEIDCSREHDYKAIAGGRRYSDHAAADVVDDAARRRSASWPRTAPRTVATTLQVQSVTVEVVAAAADRDQASAGAGNRVPVATVERLLPGDILCGTGHPDGDGRGRWPAEPDGRDDRARSGAADYQRGGMRAIPTRRSPAVADRFLSGHGFLGRAGGAHLPLTGHRGCTRRLRWL